MAENNQTETSSDGTSAEQESEQNFLDELTVLSPDESGQNAGSDPNGTYLSFFG